MRSKVPFITLLSLVLAVYYVRHTDLSFASNPLRELSTADNEDVQRVCGDIDYNDAFTDKERDRAEGFRSSLAKLRGGNPLKDWIENGGKTDTLFEDYGKGVIPYAGIWIAFFVLSIIGCCCYCCNWCCMYACCKNCCKQKLKCCKPPKTKKWFMFYLIGSVTLGTAIVGASIAGVVLSGGVSSGAQKTTCATISVFGDLIEGVSASKWQGIKGAISSLTDIGSQVTGIQTDLNAVSTSGTTTNMQTDHDDIETKLTALYTTYQSETIDRADPDASSTTYVPEYISNLGPITDSSTYLGMIWEEVDKKYQRGKEAVDEIYQNVDDIKSDLTLKDTIDSGKQSAQDIYDSLDDMMGNLADSSESINNATDKVGMGLMIVFVVSLVIAIAAVGSILLVKFCKMKFFSKITHITWCIMSIFMILGFLLAFITYPLSIVLVESCEVLDDFLTDKVFYVKVLDTLGVGGDARATLTTCLHGNGNILDQLGVTKQLDQFDTIFAQLDKTKDLQQGAGNPNSYVIPYEIDLVENTGTGVYVDSTKSTTDLATLNDYTQDANSCSPVKDTWILNSVNCTGSGYVYVTADGEATSVGSTSCLGFDQWLPAKTIATRYTATQYPGSCDTVGGTAQLDYVKDFVTKFATARQDVRDLFDNLKTDATNGLDVISTLNDDMMTEMYALTDPFADIEDAVKGVKASIFDSETGLVANCNCNFVGTALRRFSDAMCVGFISSMYQTSVCIIIVSMFSFFGSFFVFCLAKRLTVKDKKDDEDDDEK